MRATVSLLAIGLAIPLAAALSGCKNTPPPRVNVPSESGGNPYSTYQHDPFKPLPPSAMQESPFAGGTATSTAVPPASPPSMPPPQPPVVPQAYLDAYDRVGRPRLLVLIDHADSPEKAMVPGDYELLERVIRESLSAGGQVAVVPASMVRERIMPQQLRDLEAGRATALVDVGSTFRADVLVEVKLESGTNQTQLTATARNIRDGQQIATASSAIPSASPRRQIDFAGRLLGERMVDALADSWDRLARDTTTHPAAPAAAAASAAPASPSTPAAPAPPVPAPAASQPAGHP